jgi:hypothetical protein
MAPNPACEIKVGAAAYVTAVGGVDMTPLETIIIRLASQVDVDAWLIECITTDDTSDAGTVYASLTIDSTNKTATFTAPADTGKAYRFRSRVNGGIDRNGVAAPSYSTTFCLYTLVDGRRVMAADESTEGDSTFGWIKWINDMIRNFGSAAVTPGGSNGHVQFNATGTLGGDAGFSYDPVLRNLNLLGGVNLGSGASGCAASGMLKLPYSTASRDILATRDSAGTGDFSYMNLTNTTLTLGLGTSGGGDTSVQGALVNLVGIGGPGTVRMTVAGVQGMDMMSTRINWSIPFGQATLATGCALVIPGIFGAAFAGTTVYTGAAITRIGNANHRTYSEIVSLKTSNANDGVLFAWNLLNEAVTAVAVKVNAIPSGGNGGAVFGRCAKIRADASVATMGAIHNAYGEIDPGPGFTGVTGPPTGAAQASGFLRVFIGHTGMTGFVRVVGTPTGRIDWGAEICRSETIWS